MTASWRANGICLTPGCYIQAAPRGDYCATCQQVEDLARAELGRQLEASLVMARERASHETKGRR